MRALGWIGACLVCVGTVTAQPAPQPAQQPPAIAAKTGDAAPGRRFIDVPAEAGKPETGVRYALVLPDATDPKVAYPVLLVLPPGAEDESMVEASLTTYWEKEATLRGWVVVSQVAPAGKSFAGEACDLIPRVIDDVSKRVNIEGGRVHLAGASNGGRAAFRAALKFPGRFASLLAMPGFPPTPEDEAGLGTLKGMKVRLFVGADDAEWRPRVLATYERLLGLGVDVGVTNATDQSHVLTLDGAILFAELERARPADARDGAMDAQALLGVGPDILRAEGALRAAVAAGDEKGIYAAMTPEGVAVLMGQLQPLDRAGLSAWAAGSRGGGRESPVAGRARNRKAHASLGGEVGWLEQTIERQTGNPLHVTAVLSKVKSGWKVAQWHVSEAPTPPPQE